MATSKKVFPEQVVEFERRWERFKWMFDDPEQAAWEELLDRVRDRPYPGHMQLAQGPQDPKWAIAFTMLVMQQREITLLEDRLFALEERLDESD